MSSKKRYETVCEELFQMWINGEVGKNIDKHFQSEFCCEPYLDFFNDNKDKRFPVLLTHNPGEGMSIQKCKGNGGIIDCESSYAYNARKLAKYYSNNLINKPRKRIENTHYVFKKMGYNNFRQVELNPFHSKKRPSDRHLFGVQARDSLLYSYQNSLLEYIRNAELVLALTGCAVSRESKTLKKWASIYGIELSEFKEVYANDKKSVGLYYYKNNSFTRIISCSQGNNGHPSKKNIDIIYEHLIS